MGHRNHKSLRQYLKHRKSKTTRGSDWDDLLLIEPPHGARSQQALWRAVILQMVTDAITESKKPEAAAYRRDARRWLTHFTRDFRMVCHYAGYDPSWMHERVQEFLALHDKKGEIYNKNQYIERKTSFTASYQPISYGLTQQDFSLQGNWSNQTEKSKQTKNLNCKPKCDA